MLQGEPCNTYLHTKGRLQEPTYAQAHHMERVVSLLEMFPRRNYVVGKQILKALGCALQKFSIRVFVLHFKSLVWFGLINRVPVSISEYGELRRWKGIK